MNKYLLIVLMVIGLGLIAFNVTQLDPNNLFEGDSLVALIGIMAALCALVLLLVYQTSKKIEKKLECSVLELHLATFDREKKKPYQKLPDGAPKMNILKLFWIFICSRFLRVSYLDCNLTLCV